MGEPLEEIFPKVPVINSLLTEPVEETTKSMEIIKLFQFLRVDFGSFQAQVVLLRSPGDGEFRTVQVGFEIELSGNGGGRRFGRSGGELLD